MIFEEITSAEVWEEFHVAQPYAQFLQSWVWGVFRISMGAKVKRFVVGPAAGVWHVAIQMEYRPRKFGFGYWYAARGPVFAPQISDDEKRLAMVELCQGLSSRRDMNRKVLFWRFEPTVCLREPEGLMPLSCFRAPALNPASTRRLSLQMSEEDLLASMHEKTRYNIRLAERKGVKVRTSGNEKDLQLFLSLMRVTAERDQFVQHESLYLAKTFRFLHGNGMAQLRIAEWQGKVVAINLEVMYGDTFTYLYGASGNEHRDIMAPYALQWSAIQEAKKRGFHYYDFWGANPEWKGMYYYKPSFEGITRFKRGFGGGQVDLYGTWDLPQRRTLYQLAFPRTWGRG